MISIVDMTLVAHRAGRRIELEELELNYQIRALVQFNIDPAVARVFGFSNGERVKVVALAQRLGLVTR